MAAWTCDIQHLAADGSGRAATEALWMSQGYASERLNNW